MNMMRGHDPGWGRGRPAGSHASDRAAIRVAVLQTLVMAVVLVGVALLLHAIGTAGGGEAFAAATSLVP